MRGRSALITGSVDGIGFAIAEALARSGCSIMLNGFADPDLVKQRRATLSELGVEADYHGADLSVPAQIEDMVASTERRFGTIDIVVNNAVTRHYAHIDELPVEKWNYALAVNRRNEGHVTGLTACLAPWLALDGRISCQAGLLEFLTRCARQRTDHPGGEPIRSAGIS